MRSKIVFDHMKSLVDKGCKFVTIQLALQDSQCLCRFLLKKPKESWTRMHPMTYKGPAQETPSDVALRHAQKEDIDAWIAAVGPGMGPTTLARRVGAAGKLFDYMVVIGARTENPAPHMSQRLSDARRCLSPMIVAKLLACSESHAHLGLADLRLHAMLLMIHRCLLTANDCCTLRRSHLAEDLSAVALAKRPDMDIPEEVRPWLARLLEHMSPDQRLFATSMAMVKESIAKAGARAGLRGVTIDSMRLAGLSLRILEMCRRVKFLPPPWLFKRP